MNLVQNKNKIIQKGTHFDIDMYIRVIVIRTYPLIITEEICLQQIEITGKIYLVLINR